MFSACAGSQVAQNNVAKKYNEMPKEELVAAAKKGDLEAQYYYGMSYCCGIGDKYNNAIAFALICEAAKKGYAEAQFQLGSIYQSGIPFQYTGENKTPFLVPSDLAKAHMWYAVAAQNGYEKAMKAKKQLAEIIDYKRINESFKERKYWKSTDCSSV